MSDWSEIAMITSSREPAELRHRGTKAAPLQRWTLPPQLSKGRVLVIEDEELIRDSLETLLEDEGYEVASSENGRDALMRLYTESLPDVIVLDLRMPVMNGWEFKTIQKDDAKLALIPVVAISADDSAQAAAISAQVYLRKPLDAAELLAAVARVLLARVLTAKDNETSARAAEIEPLVSLGRAAVGLAHEINDPLALVMLNLRESIERLRPTVHAPEALAQDPPPEAELEAIKARLADVTDMLEDCEAGGERISESVRSLQRLSGRDK
jgi:CheY-like chemotaxis protein